MANPPPNQPNPPPNQPIPWPPENPYPPYHPLWLQYELHNPPPPPPPPPPNPPPPLNPPPLPPPVWPDFPELMQVAQNIQNFNFGIFVVDEAIDWIDWGAVMTFFEYRNLFFQADAESIALDPEEEGLFRVDGTPVEDQYMWDGPANATTVTVSRDGIHMRDYTFLESRGEEIVEDRDGNEVRLYRRVFVDEELDEEVFFIQYKYIPL